MFYVAAVKNDKVGEGVVEQYKKEETKPTNVCTISKKFIDFIIISIFCSRPKSISHGISLMVGIER